ncbi:hypothetical protein NX059_010048 [Plenodomus lindquistii]|nr:hypothetical protein NX059_010048 [Plenodomus lindquistii]
MGSGPIRCELFHARLQDIEDSIEYEALSYTWGDAGPKNFVWIDDKLLEVTANLFAALSHLRRQHEDRILWIDAISIDQVNDKERGHQVRQMGSIYRSATQVIIWLGLPSPQTDQAFSNMQLFAKNMRQQPCNNWKLSDNRWRDTWLQTLPLLEDDKERSKKQLRDGFLDLLNRSWFERVWIIQEVANARKAAVACGRYSISSRIFAIMPTLLQLEPGTFSQPIIEIMPGPSRQFSWWSQKRDLRTLMCKFRHSRASDERDSIYALLDISSDAQGVTSTAPDYSKPMHRVVQTVLRFLVDLEQDGQPGHRMPAWSLKDVVCYVEGGHLSYSLFVWAFSHADSNLMRALLRSELSADESNRNECTILEMAATKGNDEILEFALKNSQFLSLHKDSALAAAIRGEFFRCVDLLLLEGADIRGQLTKNLQSLRDHVFCREWSIFNLLIGGVYDISTPYFPPGLCPEPLFQILFALCLDVAAIDLRVRKLHFKTNRDSHEAVLRAVIIHARAPETGSDWDPALYLASSLGYYEVVKYLLDHGANKPNLPQLRDTTMRSAVSSNHQRVISLLTDRMELVIEPKYCVVPDSNSCN